MEIKNGILNVNKPQHMTSHDVVAILRRVLGTKKIGHTGTLDPMATGVLPVCVGKATKIIQYLDLDSKEYVCTLKLGFTSDTLDVWGNVEKSGDFSDVTEEKFKNVLEDFRGEITQIPPMYSAVKVNGKKLYEYAREGKEVIRKPRKAVINSLEITDADYEKGEISLKVGCGKGTYIRTLCDDIGAKLGCGAIMTALVRVSSGMFSIEDSTGVEELRNMPADMAYSLLKPAEYPLTGFALVMLEEFYGKKFVNGMRISAGNYNVVEPATEVFHKAYPGLCRVFQSDENAAGGRKFLGIGKEELDGNLKPEKIFTE